MSKKKYPISMQTVRIWAGEIKRELFEMDPEEFFLGNCLVLVKDDVKDSSFGFSISRMNTIIINMPELIRSIELIRAHKDPSVWTGFTDNDILYSALVEVMVHEMYHLHQYLPEHTKYMKKNRDSKKALVFEEDVEYKSLAFIYCHALDIDHALPKYKGYVFLPMILDMSKLEDEYKKDGVPYSIYRMAKDTLLAYQYPDETYRYKSHYRRRSIMEYYGKLISRWFYDDVREDIFKKIICGSARIKVPDYNGKVDQCITIAAEGSYLCPTRFHYMLRLLGYFDACRKYSVPLLDCIMVDDAEEYTDSNELIIYFVKRPEEGEDAVKNFSIENVNIEILNRKEKDKE